MIDKRTANDAVASAQRFGAFLRRRIYPLDILVRSAKQFMDDNASTYAAAMSYYVLFSLFPAMIFIVTLFGMTIQDPELRSRVVETTVGVVPAGFQVRREISEVLSDLSRASSPVLAIAGLLGTAWTASNMFAALRRSLNLAFNIEQDRNFLIARFMDMLNLPAILILALLSMGATALVRVTETYFNEWIIDTGLTDFTWNLIFFLMPYLISFFVFLMVYRVLPNAQYPFRYLAVGAAFTAIGFELVKGGFSLYVTNFGNYQQVYGALGGVVAFLFFVFIQSNLVIFGAVITAQVIRDYYDDPGRVAEARGVGERHRSTGAWRRLDQ